MVVIYETLHFNLISADRPHISRQDGGHVVIIPKEKVRDRTQLDAQKATELMWLTMIAGEAMGKALNKQGIDVGRINYQDNGNWSVLKPEGPYLHVHLYGRAQSAVDQKWGEAVAFPLKENADTFLRGIEPLTSEDNAVIVEEIKALEKEEKYDLSKWGLNHG